MGAKKQTSLLKEHFEPVMSDDDLSLGEDGASSEDERTDKMNQKTRVPRLESVTNLIGSLCFMVYISGKIHHIFRFNLI